MCTSLKLTEGNEFYVQQVVQTTSHERLQNQSAEGGGGVSGTRGPNGAALWRKVGLRGVLKMEPFLTRGLREKGTHHGRFRGGNTIAQSQEAQANAAVVNGFRNESRLLC